MMREVVGTYSPTFQKTIFDRPEVCFTVSRVFSASLYLSLADGRLVLIHEAGCGTLPFGIAFMSMRDVFQACPGMDVGYRGVLKKNALVFRGRFSLRLVCNEEEEIFFPEEGMSPLEFSDEGEKILALSGKGQFTQLISCFGSGKGRDLFVLHAEKHFKSLVVSISDNNLPNIEKSLKNLLGLGMGLTPSMDDFILGYLYMMMSAWDRWGIEMRGADSLREALGNCLPAHTNVYSLTYLSSVVSGGRFSLLDHIIFGEKKASITAMMRLSHMGSNSGCDILAGMIAAIKNGQYCT